MELRPTELPEVVVVKPRVFADTRGYFFESWRADTFAAAGINAQFVQDNHSHSLRHTLRGLHYQLNRPQGKLVRVTKGEVFDVAVDLRRSSPRFGRWTGVTLTESNHWMLWIPPGFAHGYLALSGEIDFLYKCTDLYMPSDERTILWNDGAIGIDWPIPAGVQPVISAKDSAAPGFLNAACFA